MNKKILIIVFSLLMMKQLTAFAVYPVTVQIINPSYTGLGVFVNVYYQRTVKDSLHIIRGREYETKGSGEYKPGVSKNMLLPTMNYQIGVGVQLPTKIICYYFQPRVKWGGRIKVGIYHTYDGNKAIYPKASIFEFHEANNITYEMRFNYCPFNPAFQ